MELTRKAVQQLNKKITTYVQVRKVNASKITINNFQVRNEFALNDQITSYVTSTHQSNRYENIDRFYRVMNKSPKYWNKRFFYYGPRGGSNERILAAALMAIEIAEQKTLAYPRISSTGHLLDSIRTYVNGPYTETPALDIRRSKGSALFELVNIAEYGSTAEARAVYVTRQQGLLFYAANRVQRRFPELGIMFRYAKAEAFGLPHVYNVPVLTIGSIDDVSGPWVRPGENIRRRKRERRRQSSTAARITRKFNGN